MNYISKHWVLGLILAVSFAHLPLLYLFPQANVYTLDAPLIVVELLLFYLIIKSGYVSIEKKKVTTAEGLRLLFSFFLFYFCIAIPIGNLISVDGTVTRNTFEDVAPIKESLQLEFYLASLTILAITEELMYRGIIFNYFKRYSSKVAIFVSTTLFVTAHFSIYSFSFLGFHSLISTTFLGLLFGFFYLKTNSLVLVSILHIMVNLLGSSSFISSYIGDTNLGYAAMFVLLLCCISVIWTVVLYLRRPRSLNFRNIRDQTT